MVFIQTCELFVNLLINSEQTFLKEAKLLFRSSKFILLDRAHLFHRMANFIHLALHTASPLIKILQTLPMMQIQIVNEYRSII